MTWTQAIITAIVEGITEFLPVSSTAHIKFAQAIMHMDAEDPFSNMFDIVIQLAAILAVVILYWKKFVNLKHYSFYVKLVIAVIPALIMGALLKKYIDKMLGNISVMAFVMVAGGILLLFVDKWFRQPVVGLEKDISDNSILPPPPGQLPVDREEDISNTTAFKVGCFQVLSILFPGLSRSAATIVGGMASGLSRRVAAEFSFFLAVPTMAAATAKEVWDTYKKSPEVFHSSNTGMLGVGCLLSFIVSLIAIRFFITYLQRHGFRLFGIYRILAGLIVLALIYGGVI